MTHHDQSSDNTAGVTKKGPAHGRVLRHLLLPLSSLLWACSDTDTVSLEQPDWTEDDFIAMDEADEAVTPTDAPVHTLIDGEPRVPDESALTPRNHVSGNQVSWFRWTKGEPVRVLQPQSTHLCALSMLRGDLDSGTILRIFPSAGRWVMGGSFPGNGSLQMDAVCVPLSAFHVNAGVTPFTRPMVAVTNFDKNTTRTINMTSFTAPILMGTQGLQNGFGERKFVAHGGSFAQLSVQLGTAGGTHAADAVPVDFGRVIAPRYASSSGQTIQSNIPTICGAPNCAVADLSENFCYISSIAGNMKGAGEWAQVFPDFAANDWTFAVSAGSGSVKATVDCLSMDQRGTVPIIR